MPNKDQLLWDRFELALNQYNFAVASYAAKQMTGAKQTDALEIIQLYANPGLVAQTGFIAKFPSAEVISYGIARLARRDPNSAINLYDRLKKKIDFNQKQQQRIFQSIALKYAMRKNPAANIWFRKIVNAHLEPVYQNWMIASALYFQNWSLVKDRIEALTPEEQQLPVWQYWYARALDRLGEKEKAGRIFKTLAAGKNYYAFLAANYSGQPIKIKNEPLKISEPEISDIENLSGFQRAKLLYHLNQEHYAALELYYVVKNATPRQKLIVMQLVSDWGWQTQSIRLGLNLDDSDGIQLQFPLMYYDVIMQNAQKRDVDPALIYAMIRQESLFTANIRSPAGAVGLMQLMPDTAARTAKYFKLPSPGIGELVNGNTNIELGTAHVRQLYSQLNNHPILVIAAYNAGKDAVYRWLPKDKKIPADIWVETVPFKETRHYLKQVIANYVIYQQRLGQTPGLQNIIQTVSEQ